MKIAVGKKEFFLQFTLLFSDLTMWTVCVRVGGVLGDGGSSPVVVDGWWSSQQTSPLSAFAIHSGSVTVPHSDAAGQQSENLRWHTKLPRPLHIVQPPLSAPYQLWCWCPGEALADMDAQVSLSSSCPLSSPLVGVLSLWHQTAHLPPVGRIITEWHVPSLHVIPPHSCQGVEHGTEAHPCAVPLCNNVGNHDRPASQKVWEPFTEGGADQVCDTL